MVGLLSAQGYKISTDIRINKIINANLNSNDFIFLYDDFSEFSMIIGATDKMHFISMMIFQKKAIRDFINAINKAAKDNSVVESIEIIQNSYFINYSDYSLHLKMDSHLVFEIIKK